MAPRKAVVRSTPTPEELEESFDIPALIPQEDLSEYLEAKRRLGLAKQQYLRAREEVEVLGNCLVEALTLGSGVANGPLTALICDNDLVVGPIEGEFTVIPGGDTPF